MAAHPPNDKRSSSQNNKTLRALPIGFREPLTTMAPTALNTHTGTYKNTFHDIALRKSNCAQLRTFET